MPSSHQPTLEMLDTDVAGAHDSRDVVLEKVHWTVHPQEFWVVIGMNRTGKTDLLTTAAGLVPPRRGLCKLFGYDTRYPSDAELRASRVRLGVVFESGQLLHGLSVWENIALPLRYHKNLSANEAIEAIKPLLDYTGLGPLAKAYPDRLGRAWRQRVGLARALVLQPELLLLDNPMAGLDPEEIDWWSTALLRLAEGDPSLTPRPITIILTVGFYSVWRAPQCRYAVIKNRAFQVLEGEPNTSLFGAPGVSAGSLARPNGMNG